MKKAAKGHPFLPMFVGDFMAATAEWEGEEQALYGLLLMHQWAIGHLPVEVAKLARLAKYDQHNFERWWPVVSSKFEQISVPSVGLRLVNQRLEQHRAKSSAIAEQNANSGKRGAEARWRKDGARHEEVVANATGSDGGRHQSANGALNGNPSHPNPSHPEPSSESSGKSPQAQGTVAQAEPASPFVGNERGVKPVDRVFTHWRETHRHPKAQLDPKRRALIVKALKHYTEADLCQAISGYRNSPHHMGQNDSGTVYDGIELLLRDAKHIDAGIKFFDEPPRTDLSIATRRTISQTEDWIPPEQRRAG